MHIRGSGLVCLMAALPLAAPVAAQEASETGRAKAAIVEPLRTVRLADLSFGALSVGPDTDGEVRVAPLPGSVSFTGSAAQICGGSTSCLPHPGRFAVSGEAGRTYQVSLPQSIEASGRETGQSLRVHALEMRSRNLAGSAACNWCGLLDNDGKDEFTIGGRLLVPAGTQADSFRADLPVSVSYN